MKLITVIIILLIYTSAHGQPGTVLYARQNIIVPIALQAGFQKTTSVIFPGAIKNIDRGSTDIIVQKTPGVENVLMVKAATMGFEETNLSVITADGQFYTFDVTYRQAPEKLTLVLGLGQSQTATEDRKPSVLFPGHMTNETVLRKLAAQASITRRNISNTRDKDYETELELTGLYLANDCFFYKFMIRNNSNVNYDIDDLLFYISDKKKIKRVATQELALQPLLVIGAGTTITGHSERMLIAILPKQTITSDKRLVVTLEEKNGGRNLRCMIKNNTLLKAKPIVLTKAIDNIPNVITTGN